MKNRLLVIFAVITAVMLTLLATFKLAEGQERRISEDTPANLVVDPLTVTGVEPDTVVYNRSYMLTISGTGFTDTFTVSIGTFPMVEAAFINTTTLQLHCRRGCQSAYIQ